MTEYADSVAELSRRLQRPTRVVENELRLIAYYRRNIVRFINDYFVIEGWLYHALNKYQTDMITRMHTGGARVCEVVPRGHLKTTLARAYAAAMIALGLERYTVVIAVSDGNNDGNIEAIKDVFDAEHFEPVQRLAHYFYGVGTFKASGNLLTFGEGRHKALAEFRTLMGEMRGMNKVKAGGRPSLVIGDDIVHSDSYDSRAIRKRALRRFISMVEPLGKKGARILVNGTALHEHDIIGMIRSGKFSGYRVTPIEQQRSYDPDTGSVLFPERWTLAELLAERKRYEDAGLGHLFRCEFMNDTKEPVRFPLQGMPLPRFDEATITPWLYNRVIVVDHAHGAARDYFVIMELAMDQHGTVYLLQLRRSNTWTVAQRRAELVAAIRTRTPHKLIMEDTSESRTFIDTFETEVIPAEHLPVAVTRVYPHERGSKSQHIVGRLQPKMLAGTIQATPEIAALFDAEASAYDYDADDNVDDIMDTAATGIRALTPADPIAKPQTDIDRLITKRRRKHGAN